MTGPLDDVGPPSERRLAVRVTPDALRQVRGGSPWIYDGSVTSVSGDGAAGDLAVVFDDRRRFAAIGLWDPASPIRVRVLHVGRPTPIDRDFWSSRLDAALERRASLASDPTTTAYRCVHGENDRLPGVVMDLYERTLVVKIYTAAWLPHLRDLLDVVAGRMGVERVVLRLGRSVAGPPGIHDGVVLAGPPVTGPIVFRERGLLLEADVVSGQKTGHFLDQRDNRTLVRGLAADADVLDVFASTGGFSVAAAAGGATSVHLVDQSAPAIDAAVRNLARNRDLPEVRRARVETTVGDAFEVMRNLLVQGREFDVAVVDPPSFASNQAAVGRAVAAYERLTGLAVALIRPGGTLVQASCSARVTLDQFAAAVHGAARRAGASVREVRRTGHPVDHPVGFEYGDYLKAIHLKVDRPPAR